MRRILFMSVALLLLPVVAAAADAPPTFPKGPPPQFVLLAGASKDKGALVVQVAESVPVTKTVAVTEIVGGQAVTRQVAFTDYQTVTKQEEWSLKSFRVLDAQGKEIEGDEVWKRLKAGDMVLRQAGPEPIDPAYLKMFAKETVILAPKPMKEPQPPK
jgi:hypothetical protein